MKINGLFSKFVAFILVITFVVPASYFFRPEKAEAGAISCIVGWLEATPLAAPALIKEIIGVPVGDGKTGSAATQTAGDSGGSFTECILKPLATIMVVALIRNIGASIVDWVNSGFEGKPLFLTDFGGFLRDTADEALGEFIEGTELGFLCKPFAFQIRIALAYKYSQPFRKRITCRLSDVAQNIDNFINNNGDVGWDDWLDMNIVPTNNVYGAYLTAESELARKVVDAVAKRTKPLEWSSGFLDFKTCTRYENETEVAARVEGGGAFETMSTRETDATKVVIGTGPIDDTLSPEERAGYSAPVYNNSLDNKPQCLEETVATPGSTIAKKLDSTLGQGDIQQAVAQEIDAVIAATMNQIAQKALMGAAGLLGLSKGKGYSSGAQYKKKYERLYHSDAGGSSATSFNASGATTETENYRFASFADASAGINSNSTVQDINNTTDQTATKAVNERLEQQNALNAQLQGTSTSKNVALNQPARASSVSKSANNANNGVRSESTTAFGASQPFQTAGNEANPYWEVDLRSETQIQEVRVWRVDGIPAGDSLETFYVEGRDTRGDNDTNPWRSSAVVATDSSPNPIIIPVNQKKQYIRVVKNAAPRQSGRRTYRNPLSIAEVEVMDVGTTPSGTTVPVVIGSGGATSTAVTIVNTTPDLTIKRGTGAIVTSNNSLVHESQITVGKDTARDLILETALFKNDVATPFLSVFDSYDIAYGTTGGTTLHTPISRSTDGSGSFSNITVTPTAPYSFVQTGIKRQNALTGTYKLTITLRNRTGEIIETQTTEFVVQ